MIDVAKMTPAEMLALHDRKIGGDPVTDDEGAAADRIVLAAAFGSQAFMQHVGCDGGATIAMLRAFLTALAEKPQGREPLTLRCPAPRGPASIATETKE